MRLWSILIFSMIPVSNLKAEAIKKTFVYCSEGSPSNFNPQVASDGTTFTNTMHLYNQLLKFKSGSTELEPDLAESYSISKDGLTYTFKLKPNVSFHTTDFFKPTRKLNAEDVVFSFERQMKKDHPYNKVGGGSYEYFNSMDMQDIIVSVKAIDSMTVEFKLSKPEAPFLADLAMDFAAILSKEYADQLLAKNKKEEIDYLPVGTGPFKWVKYIKDQSVRYKANPEFYGEKPKYETLIFTITQEPSVRYQKLKAGECDLMSLPAPQDVKSIQTENKLKLLEQEGLNVGYIAFNVTKKPFDNVLVRQALNYAVDKKSYIDAVYLGQAMIAKNPMPPTIWSYNKSNADYEYNPKKAKELLKKAGFPNGFETELWTLPVSRPYIPNGKKLGEMIQENLAQIGVKVKLVSFDWPTYLAKSKNGEHAMLEMGWTGDNGDPDNFLNTLLGCSSVEAGNNRARWCDKEYDALVEKARLITDPKARTELYLKAQVIFQKQAPWIPIAHAKVYRAMNKKTMGYVMDPLGKDYLGRVSVSL